MTAHMTGPLPPRECQASRVGGVGAPTPVAPQGPEMTEEGDDSLRNADQFVHAGLAWMSSGISQVSLLQAWQDWMLHLAISPGKRQHLLTK